MKSRGPGLNLGKHQKAQKLRMIWARWCERTESDWRGMTGARDAKGVLQDFEQNISCSYYVTFVDNVWQERRNLHAKWVPTNVKQKHVTGSAGSAATKTQHGRQRTKGGFGKAWKGCVTFTLLIWLYFCTLLDQHAVRKFIYVLFPFN